MSCQPDQLVSQSPQNVWKIFINSRAQLATFVAEDMSNQRNKLAKTESKPKPYQIKLRRNYCTDPYLFLLGLNERIIQLVRLMWRRVLSLPVCRQSDLIWSRRANYRFIIVSWQFRIRTLLHKFENLHSISCLFNEKLSGKYSRQLSANKRYKN